MLDMATIKYIGLHHTATSVKVMPELDQFLALKNNCARKWGGKFEMDYHYLIGGITGKVFHGQPERTVCPHIGIDIGEGPVNNWNTLGIAVMANFQVDRMPLVVINSVVTLVKELVIKYSLSKADVFRHSDIVSTACPGKNYPFSTIKKKVFNKTPWYEGEMNRAITRGLITGDEGGIRPNDMITRAESFVVANRVIDYILKKIGETE